MHVESVPSLDRGHDVVSVFDEPLDVSREGLAAPVLGLVDDLHDGPDVRLVQPQLARQLGRERVRKFAFGVEPEME